MRDYIENLSEFQAAYTTQAFLFHLLTYSKHSFTAVKLASFSESSSDLVLGCNRVFMHLLILQNPQLHPMACAYLLDLVVSFLSS